jgi:hypothetical protein
VTGKVVIHLMAVCSNAGSGSPEKQIVLSLYRNGALIESYYGDGGGTDPITLTFALFHIDNVTPGTSVLYELTAGGTGVNMQCAARLLVQESKR